MIMTHLRLSMNSSRTLTGMFWGKGAAIIEEPVAIRVAIVVAPVGERGYKEIWRSEPGVSRSLLPDEMGRDMTAVRGVAVFPKINALPGAQGQSAVRQRDGKIDRSQGGSNVGGHVVIAFGGMNE